MAPTVIAIDAGTTRIKSIAIDETGTELARATRPAPVSSPHPGWSEQDMTATWERTAETLREVLTAIDDSRTIDGVGVTGQGAGCWLVDADGDPVRDAILWSDGRAADYVRRWRATDAFVQTFAELGYGLFPGLPLPILRWLQDEEPDSLQRARTALFCKDWIRFRLTGVRGTDTSDASLANYRPDAGQFSPAAAERLGVSCADLIPDAKKPTAVAGTVTEVASARTGVPAGTPVITGAMDVASSALGSGAATPGDASAVVGTTLQTQVITERPRFESPESGYTLSLGVEGLGLRSMGAMTGTPNLDWARSELSDAADFERIERAVRSVPVACDGVMYHPYLSAAGEKAPFVHPGARAQFTGLTENSTRAHLLRAVYEGVALAMRDCFEHLPGDAAVRVSGGGARSDFWCQLFADCLDRPVIVPTGTELGAKGVALLVRLALGHDDSLASAIDRSTAVKRQYDPIRDRAARYARWYEVYRSTAEAMFEVWDRRAELSREGF